MPVKRRTNKRREQLCEDGERWLRGEPCGFFEFKDAAERAFLLNKLREFDWNVSETARAVEMPRSNLYKKIERYSLSREHS